MDRDRFDFIDIARGICIILMVYAHAERGLDNAKILPLEGAFLFLDSTIYLFHMPLFFVVSGYLMGRSKRKVPLKKQFTNNVKAIAIPYLIWKNFFNVIKLIVPSRINFPAEPLTLTGLLYPAAHFWFLFSLFIAKTISGFVTRKGNIGLLLISVLAYLLLPNPWGWSTGLVFFSIGRLLGDFSILSSSHYVKNQTVIMTIAGVLFGGMAIYAWQNGVALLLSLFAAIAGTMMIIGISHRISWQWLRYVGANTMVIYLLHVIFSAAFRIISQSYLGIENPVYHLAGGTLVGILGPLIFLKILDLTSLRKFAFVG